MITEFLSRIESRMNVLYLAVKGRTMSILYMYIIFNTVADLQRFTLKLAASG